MELEGHKRRSKGRPKNKRKTDAQKDIKTTCLSKGTGSAFKGGEFAQHSLNSSVKRNIWGIPKAYVWNAYRIHKEYLRTPKGRLGNI